MRLTEVRQMVWTVREIRWEDGSVTLIGECVEAPGVEYVWGGAEDVDVRHHGELIDTKSVDLDEPGVQFSASTLSSLIAQWNVC